MRACRCPTAPVGHLRSRNYYNEMVSAITSLALTIPHLRAGGRREGEGLCEVQRRTASPAERVGAPQQREGLASCQRSGWVRSLEGQDPLVVLNPKELTVFARTSGIGASRSAVFGELPSPFGVRKQIPLQRSVEGIHADELSRLLVGHICRDVATVEFGRPMERDSTPHRRARSTESAFSPET